MNCSSQLWKLNGEEFVGTLKSAVSRAEAWVARARHLWLASDVEVDLWDCTLNMWGLTLIGCRLGLLDTLLVSENWSIGVENPHIWC